MRLSYAFGIVHIETPGPPTNTSEDGFPTLLSAFVPTHWVTTSNRLNYDQTLKPTLLLHLGASYVGSSLSMPTAVTGYNADFGNRINRAIYAPGLSDIHSDAGG